MILFTLVAGKPSNASLKRRMSTPRTLSRRMYFTPFCVKCIITFVTAHSKRLTATCFCKRAIEMVVEGVF